MILTIPNHTLIYTHTGDNTVFLTVQHNTYALQNHIHAKKEFYKNKHIHAQYAYILKSNTAFDVPLFFLYLS